MPTCNRPGDAEAFSRTLPQCGRLTISNSAPLKGEQALIGRQASFKGILPGKLPGDVFEFL